MIMSHLLEILISPVMMFLLKVFYNHPRKHLLVFKTFRRRPQDMPWRPLQHVSSVTIFVFEDVLKTSWRHLARRLGRRKIVMLKTFSRRIQGMSWKTSWIHVLKMSWRQTKCLLWTSVSNKSNCASKKSIFHKSMSDESKANQKCIN